MSKAVIKVQDIYKSYNSNTGIFKRAKSFGIPAIDHVSFELYEGETLGLIGESGSGKTTIGKVISKLIPVQSGKIEIFEQDITALNERQFKPVRKDLQVIFQDLDAALNPSMKIRQSMSDILKLYYNKSELQSTLEKLLSSVKLETNVLEKYPSELSGGQKRRIAIANVLATNPKIIIADEPTTGLDNYTQSLILKLIKNLQAEYRISMLLISHDLQVIKDNCQRVIVLYLGRIVESGPIEVLSRNPAHPYTKLLWSTFDNGMQKQVVKTTRKHNVRSGLHDFERPQKGCRFAPRCSRYVQNGKPDICTNSTSTPELIAINQWHKVACHFIEK